MSSIDQIPFGKHSGTAIADLPLDYIDWMLRAHAKGDFSHGWWVDEYEEELRAAGVALPANYSPDYELAEDQLAAADAISNWLFEDGLLLARVQGGAGYGKSFAAKEIVLRAKRQGYRVRACATSYVATNNLAADLEPMGVLCNTIASTLRLDVIREGPLERYQPGPNTHDVLAEVLGPRQLLIVDEYSMVDDIVAKLLTDAVGYYQGRLLVIGDAYQLPSPAQNWDSALCQVEPVATLTIPKRYPENSDLFEVEKLSRDNPYNFEPRQFSGMCSLQVFNASSMERYLDSFVRIYKEYDNQKCMMLWHKRADMAQSNQAIRTALFGEDTPDIGPGETLRIQKTMDYTETYGSKEEIRYYSGTSLRIESHTQSVLELAIPEMDKVFRIPINLISPVEAPENKLAVLFAITNTEASKDKLGGNEYNTALNEISAWCSEHRDWKPHWAFQKCFIQVAYEYASTIHRVQGQSIDNVFVSPEALRQCDNYTSRKLQYVGFTRAKQRFFCL